MIRYAVAMLVFLIQKGECGGPTVVLKVLDLNHLHTELCP